MQGVFIKALTTTGGGLFNYASAVTLELANTTWNQITTSILNRSREGKGMVAVVLDLLSRFGGNSFESVLRLVGRAFEFLTRLMGMVGNRFTPTSKLQSIKL